MSGSGLISSIELQNLSALSGGIKNYGVIYGIIEIVIYNIEKKKNFQKKNSIHYMLVFFSKIHIIL
jgi:hypothetical protein